MRDSKWMTVAGRLAVAALLVTGTIATAEEAVQTDWCGGDGLTGPVAFWEAGFDSCRDVSWLSLPGQISLASEPLSTPVMHMLASGHSVAFGVHAVDIDQDGDVDVIGGAGEAQKVLLWYNDGQSPPGWTEQVVDAAYPGASDVHAADIDGDQDLDIVAAAENPGNRLAWWRNDGGAPILWTRQTLDDDFPVSCSITTTDIDQDGRPDVLATSWSAYDVTWWRNNGGDPVLWTRQTIDPFIQGAHDACAADLDDDGDLDVVSAGGIVNRVNWFRNNGGDPITWQRLLVGGSFTGARAVSVADIDRDGRLDVVAVAFDSHVSWWRNEGGDPLAWTRQDIDSTFNGGHGVWTGDIDGDGRVDVMATAYYDHTVSWYRNVGGDPIAWEEHELITDWLNPMNVHAGDLDADGDLDVVATSRELGEFAWWEATGFRAAGELRGAILDLQEAPASAELDWTAVQSPGAGLAFSLRSSDDPGDLGAWSDPVTTPGPLSAALGRYVQYKVELTSTDSTISPIVEDLALSWEPASDIPGDPALTRRSVLLQAANPTRGRAAIDLVLSAPCRVELTLFDPTGRRVAFLADRVFAAGRHRLFTDGLASGAYLCRARAGTMTWCERIVVVQ